MDFYLRAVLFKVQLAFYWNAIFISVDSIGSIALQSINKISLKGSVLMIAISHIINTVCKHRWCLRKAATAWNLSIPLPQV